MTPNNPLPGQNDETARSHPTNNPTAADRTATDPPTGGPADATVVRPTPSAPTVSDEASATNFGRYELVGEIARGGMGVVYRARQPGLDRLVALKMILGADGDKEAAQRFLLEARAAAALDHPNVLPIYDIDAIGGRPYFTMALVDGPNLRGFVDANGQPSIPTIVSLFAQIVAGVAHAHRHGIVHRDLKPANVLIDTDGRPRVTDFGLAKRASADSQLTATGQVVGTPAYMPPEQARDSKDVGPPADVYSLGAILYYLLTGRPPFHADSVTDLLIKVVMEAPVPPSQLRPDVPADIEALCLRCLAKSPADRFADARELAAALRPLMDRHLSPSANVTASEAQIAFHKGPTTPSLGGLSGASSTGTVPSLGSILPPAKPNRKPLLIALGAAALLLLAVAAFLATRDRSKPDTPSVNKGTPPADVKPQPAPAADKFAWPAPTRDDFGLKVSLTAPAATKNADGSVRLTTGTDMKVHLTAARDCHVSVWVLDPTGQVTRIFPNKHVTDDRLTANTERVLPGSDAYTLEAFPTAGDGRERLRVIATTGPQPPFPPGAAQGHFTAYTTPPERERVASTVRGIVVKPAGAPAPSGANEVAEGEILFRVD